MTIIHHLQWRYATKKFNPDKVLEPSKLNVLKEAFNLTATSYGLQPIRLVIVQNKSIQEQLMEASWNQKQVRDASHILILCTEQNIDSHFIRNYFNRVKEIRKTPEDILTPFENFLIEDFEKKSADQIQNWATQQAYLALGNLLTVCAAEGIDSCPMEGFKPETYSQILGLQKHQLNPVLVLPVGYRADDDMFADFKKVRKKIHESILDIS